jgi:hypothetical protein
VLLSRRPYLIRRRGVPARRPDTISREQERVVMERGLEALKRMAGAWPMGDRPHARTRRGGRRRDAHVGIFIFI